ncbi:MAG: metallopeptidase family protein [Thermomicrobiales bacterium]
MERIRRRRFERLVAHALRDLPDAVQRMLNNVAVVVEDQPSSEHLAEMDGDTLFGLYQGVPLTERGSGYSMVLPDKITIFRRSIEEACSTPRQIENEVRITVIHELAHHLGIDEDRLEELGWQ